MVLHGCWHDRSSDTMMLIIWALWHTWPRKLGEMCVNISYTPWSKGMTTRVAIHREHTCQLVLTRLRDSRDRKHKIETFLFYLESYGHGISQRCVQQYKIHCGRRTQSLEWWNIDNTHVNRQELCLWTAEISCTRKFITLSYWALWSWNFAEVCSRIWNTCGWKEFYKQNGVLPRTCMPISNGASAKMQGQQAQRYQ